LSSERVQLAAAVLALLSICVPLTAGAYLAFPLWDDGSLWLQIREKGTEAIVASWPARPVNAHLWAALAPSEHAFWLVALVAQAVLWPLLAVLSVLLWRRAYPELQRYAPLVACVAIAPFLTRVQLLTASIALGGLLSVLLAYGSILLLLRFASQARRSSGAVLGVGLALMAAAVLLNEYGVAAALAGAPLLFFGSLSATDRGAKRRGLAASASLVAVTVACYAAYLLLSDYEVTRPSVHPLHSVAVAEGGLLRPPLRLGEAIWDGLIGALAGALANLDFQAGRANVAAAALGAITAGLLLVATRQRDRREASPEAPAWGRPLLVLLLALAAGLAPVAAMGRSPWHAGHAMDSRFALPVLPILAALLVRGLVGLVQPRYWAVPVLLLGFAAGSAGFSDAWSEIRERRTLEAVGAALRPHVAPSDGLSVAIVSLPERRLGFRSEWELAARIGASWPDALRSRFWAFDAVSRAVAARALFGTRGACRDPGEVNIQVARFVERRGHVRRVLWVEPERHAPIAKVLAGEIEVRIERYCVEERPRGENGAGIRSPAPGEGGSLQR
jgi:hypothetical protein